MSEKKRFVVIGLGSFGTALASRLAGNKCRVTGVDSNKMRVEALKDVLYEAVIADATNREAIEHLPLHDADTVFISLGEDISRSLLATLHVKRQGAKRIIVKGVTKEHGDILYALGVNRVIFPEIEIAVSLADRSTWKNIVDFVPIDSDYSFVEIAVPELMVGKTLAELKLRQRFKVSLIGVKEALGGKLEMFPDGNFRIGPDQILLMVGSDDALGELQKLQ
jgi:trk system potassium uptake protein TrkA